MNLRCWALGHTEGEVTDRAIRVPVLPVLNVRSLSAARSVSEIAELMIAQMSAPSFRERWLETLHCGRCRRALMSAFEGERFDEMNGEEWLPAGWLRRVGCFFFGHDDAIERDMYTRSDVSRCRQCHSEFWRWADRARRDGLPPVMAR